MPERKYLGRAYRSEDGAIDLEAPAGGFGAHLGLADARRANKGYQPAVQHRVDGVVELPCPAGEVLSPDRQVGRCQRRAAIVHFPRRCPGEDGHPMAGSAQEQQEFPGLCCRSEVRVGLQEGSGNIEGVLDGTAGGQIAVELPSEDDGGVVQNRLGGLHSYHMRNASLH